MSVADAIVYVVVIFAVIAGSIISAQVWFGMSNSIELALRDPTGQDNTTQVVIASTNQAFNVIDAALMMAMVGVGMGMIILAYIANIRPIFYPVAIVIAPVILVLAAPFANTLVDLTTDDALSDADIQDRWPMTTFLIQRYPAYIAVVTMGLIVALFAKPRD